jgi:hypothetical protein
VRPRGTATDESRRRLIIALAQRRLSEDSFIAQFGTNPRTTPDIIRIELEHAFEEKSAASVECALVLGFVFGLSRSWAPQLCKLMQEDWHQSHEDIASLPQDIRVPSTVDCIYQAALRKHDYLAYDNSEALAVKCIWALHDIGTPEAVVKLTLLSQSASQPISKNALERLSELAARRPGDPEPYYRRARDAKVHSD